MLTLLRLVCVAIVASVAACTSPSATARPSRSPDERSHVDLYPMDASGAGMWPQTMVDVLLGNWDWNWWMVSSPSFWPDYAIRIDGPDAISSEAKEWSVELTLVNEIIPF